MAECACGRTFSPVRADAKYCSSSCRQWAHRRRKAAPGWPETAADGPSEPVGPPNKVRAAPGPALRTASGKIIDLRALIG
jgi:hypothetical protein